MNICLVPFMLFVNQPLPPPQVVVVPMKCPTEIVGIKTPSSIAVHKALDVVFECANKMQPLYELKQVCS